MAVRLNARTARAGCARELYQSSQILTRHSGARAKPASPESIITVGGYEADQVHVPVSLSRAQFMLTARARAYTNGDRAACDQLATRGKQRSHYALHSLRPSSAPGRRCRAAGVCNSAIRRMSANGM